ncbi:PulJ/GspJ family protein [Coraliomargarita parva]|uniref:PulJ/GspJ family protein n=1 Tax=Coraliomargarita parva TaxID=3014050 RepID=UPI0022B2F74B|nr:prepilin-type N-terminal cleavage/methylation domain-containing protein [Coraliomargarita parva]
MPHTRNRHSYRREAFTLLEVIFAVAVTSLLLAGAVAIVVGMTEGWAKRDQRYFFEDHVDGVTEFLRASFAAAGTSITLDTEDDSSSTEEETDTEGDTNTETDTNVSLETDTSTETDSTDTSTSDSSSAGGLITISEDPIGWARPPGFAGYEKPLLNFKLSSAPPLFVADSELPALGVDVYLYFKRDEGLSLIWYSILQEETEDIQDLRRTELSALVKEIRYIYWDESFEKWEEEQEPKEGDGADQYLMPRYLKLIFEYKGETTSRTLAIPVVSRSALIF